jgi:hypothetical protein
MKLKLLILALIVVAAFVTCTKNSYNTTPTLKFLGVNSTIIPQQSAISFQLQCTDKEGDVVDTIWIQRVSKVSGCESLSRIDSFAIPDFSPPKNVKAEFDFNYNYASPNPPNLGACTIGNNVSTTDTSYFRFWMHDKAQHISDTVQSPDIALLKQ